MTPHAKSATIRFSIDADLLGLARILAELRSDVTFPGDRGGIVFKKCRPPYPIQRGALDVEWLPEAARRQWLIITRDRNIQQHRREIAAVRESGARMIALVGADARTKFDQLEVVMCRWRDIEKCLGEPGPFTYQASRTRLTPVDLTQIE
ncbi:PIN-like domain-containing protein [Amycolatopsis pigmentata]|uniref:VapC45 PIN like domain-containing protein n=1 Tax=Amycolatopsis pigmentata TaxID=450801 RepID=A0ABW5FZL8_9PSEU